MKNHKIKICILQGPFSPLFDITAKKLVKKGFDVYKINFNAGDVLYSLLGRGVTTINYTDTPDAWPEWMKNFLTTHDIQVVLGHGDCHFYHKTGFEVARSLGVLVYVTEEGYIRPSFITLEKSGVNAFSNLMDINFSEHHLVAGQDCNTPVRDLSSRTIFFYRFVFCSLYYIAHTLFGTAFPAYRHRRQAKIHNEVIGWATSAFRKMRSSRKDKQIFEEVTSSNHAPFFLVPLQVYCDSQVIVHSDYDNMESFIGHVMHSFSRHASSEHLLVFKHHPYCIGFSDYTQVINTLALEHGITHRVRYILTGHLPTLLKAATGVITINSTVGISALHHGCPVKVMGNAFFNKEGLCHQGGIDTFWWSPTSPDKNTYSTMLAILKQRVLINGGLYRHIRFTSDQIVDHLTRQLEKSSVTQGSSETHAACVHLLTIK